MRSIIAIVFTVVLAAGFAACSNEEAPSGAVVTTGRGSSADPCPGVSDPKLCAKVKRMTSGIRTSAGAASRQGGGTVKRTVETVTSGDGFSWWWLLVIVPIVGMVAWFLLSRRKGRRAAGKQPGWVETKAREVGKGLLLLGGTFAILWIASLLGFPKSVWPADWAHTAAIVIFVIMVTKIIPGKIEDWIVVAGLFGLAIWGSVPILGAPVPLDDWWWWITAFAALGMLYYPRVFESTILQVAACAATCMVLGALSASA